MPYVFDFDHTHPRPPMELKDLLGGKGANLAEMTSVLELPVPPGFTISTDACRAYMAGGWPKGLDAEVAEARARLEKAMGKEIGDAADPLLVSVRSGAKFSMPGMMDTVLNLGLNDESVEGLAKQTGDERFAFDSYRRFIAMYGRIVLELPGEEFDSLFEAAKELAGTDVGRQGAGRAAALPGRLLPADRRAPHRQALPPEARRTSCAAPSRRCSAAGTGRAPSPTASASASRTTSAPRSTCRPWCSATATTTRAPASGFTRDPATGAKGAYGDFLVNAQGEDVVAGIRNTEPISELKKQFPKVHAELLEIFAPARGALPRHVRHRVHHRAGQALDAPDPGGQAHRRRRAARWRSTWCGRATSASPRPRRCRASPRTTSTRCCTRSSPARATPVWAKGLGASPGAAVGRIYFTADDAAAAAERGEQVVLVRSETSPEDVHGMLAAEGILTARGGLVSHAAVVARGWGKPAVVGAEVLAPRRRTR